MFPLEKTLDRQLRAIRGSQPTLVFPEADDPRVVEAASRLIQYAKIVLVRRREDVERELDERNADLGVSRMRFLQSVRFAVPAEEPVLCDEMAAELERLSQGRSWKMGLAEARAEVERPVMFAIMAVRLGYADAVLGGVTHSSRDFFKPCLRILDKDGTVYEMGLFALPDSHDAGFFEQNLVMFADVALNPEPSPERLADIAVGACVTMRHLIPPEALPEVRGALLSYSTRGSGTGPSVERVRRAEPLIDAALARLAAEDPLLQSIHIAAELQVSCAISRSAARTKLGELAEANPAFGRSNVLIAPSLDTGNLLYHIYATRFPDAQSVLIIGGLRNQALDFSRGSSTQDIVLGAKALILRTYRLGRFSKTPKDHFFPRYVILTIGPHAEHTEVALWTGRDLLAREKIAHDAASLPSDLNGQVPVRLEAVRRFLAENGVDRSRIQAYVGRGGLVLPVESGAYRVDARMIGDLERARAGRHVVNLGAILARAIAGPDEPNVFIIDPAVVDELDETARITGLKGTEQEATWHALAQKSAAKRYALERGREYEDLRLIIAYLGVGISVGAHVGGRCVKVRNALYDGPMSPTRAGTLPGRDLIDLCYSGRTKEEVVELLTQEGGLRSYLGTSDVAEVERRIEAGDELATTVFAAMIEQIAAEIASLVPKLGGEPVDRLILTGELARSERLVRGLEAALSHLKLRMSVFPGDFELEALRDGALRVLNGIEPVREYRPLRERP